jgi:hypothetical protein
VTRGTRRAALGLAESDAGAVLVVGVFMAVFLVGMLFYVVGIADAAFERERLQDASDAMALSAAALHARGMNLIVLTNQLMAALLGVLVALRLVEMLATLASLLLAVAAFFGAEIALSALPALENVRAAARQAQAALDGPVHASLRALHLAAGVVRDVVPAIAEAEVLAAEVPRHRPPADAGFVVLPRLTLPLTSDRFSVLCARAGEDVGRVAALPFSSLPLPGAVRGAVSDAVSVLSTSASQWFCGAAGSQRPLLEREITRVLPTLAARSRCESLASAGDPAAARSCEEASRREAASTPSPSGGCREHCEPDGPFEERARKAREQCDPRARLGLRGFVWQEHVVHLELRRRGGGWVPSGRRTDLPSRLVSGGEGSTDHPCGDVDARYSKDYESGARATGDGAAAPICGSRWSPPSVSGSVATMARTEVTAILGCRVTETVSIGTSAARGELERDGEHDSEAPLRVEAALEPDGDELQLRAVALHRDALGGAESVIRVAAWGRPVARSPLRLPFALGLAQAEYGFAGVGAPGEWMWSRRWTSQLHRLRPSRVVARQSEWTDSCRRALGGAAICAALGDLGELSRASSH